MSNIIRRPQATTPASPPVQPDEVLNAEIIAAERAGIAAVARLRAGAFATLVALLDALALGRVANAAYRANPLGEDVYQALFSAYGALAVTEITGLRRGHS
jgi:hypothetical protein